MDFTKDIGVPVEENEQKYPEVCLQKPETCTGEETQENFRSVIISEENIQIEFEKKFGNLNLTKKRNVEETPASERPCSFCRKYGTIRKGRIYSAGESSICVTKCEFRRHQEEESCWVLSNKDVFDVTNYLNEHPGGKTCFLRRSREMKDCSEDRMFHSKRGKEKWNQFRVAKLVACDGTDQPTYDMCTVM